ncbi:MAG: hypothetical protein ACM3MF_03965 [Anaerolineae bacterium]
MKFLVLLGCVAPLGACSGSGFRMADNIGPTIDGVATSTQSFSIDCAPTSVTVSARVTDPSGIGRVQLWYRIGTEQPYVPLKMPAQAGSDFRATVSGASLSPDQYGTWEFYISAEDTLGNRSTSPVNKSIQFLPCVSH